MKQVSSKETLLAIFTENISLLIWIKLSKPFHPQHENEIGNSERIWIEFETNEYYRNFAHTFALWRFAYTYKYGFNPVAEKAPISLRHYCNLQPRKRYWILYWRACRLNGNVQAMHHQSIWCPKVSVTEHFNY